MAPRLGVAPGELERDYCDPFRCRRLVFCVRDAGVGVGCDGFEFVSCGGGDFFFGAFGSY